MDSVAISNQFIDARTISLKLFMVYYTNRRDYLYMTYGSGGRGNGVLNASLEQRRAWGKHTLASSDLRLPSAATYGVGSLEKLFDTLHPPKGWMELFTPTFHDEFFLLYATLVVWVTVVAAGFGSEVVLGEGIILKTSDSEHREWLGMAWHAAQLAFSLFLTVASFEHATQTCNMACKRDHTDRKTSRAHRPLRNIHALVLISF